MMGRDQGALQNNGKAVDANVFLWDNNGVCRGRIPLNDYKTDRLLFIRIRVSKVPFLIFDFVCTLKI